MKELLVNSAFFIFAIQSTMFHGQNIEKPAPRFSITISEQKGSPIGEHRINVRETNLSDTVLSDDTCLPLQFRLGVNIEVAYNGVLLTLNQASPMVQLLEKRRSQPMPCEGSIFGHAAQPGTIDDPKASFEDSVPVSMLYDMTRSGSYRITVTRETDPANPSNSITVRSNTIILAVAPPKAAISN